MATLSGQGQPGSTALGSQPSNADSTSSATLCSILETPAPFSAEHLAALYLSHTVFVSKWDAATTAEVKEGYLLEPDAQALDRAAAASSVGG